MASTAELGLARCHHTLCEPHRRSFGQSLTEHPQEGIRIKTGTGRESVPACSQPDGPAGYPSRFDLSRHERDTLPTDRDHRWLGNQALKGRPQKASAQALQATHYGPVPEIR